MVGSGCRQAAVAFWALLGAVGVITLAAVAGNLAPALLPAGPRDALGLMALGLIFAAHVLPPAAGLARLARPPASVPLGLVGGEA